MKIGKYFPDKIEAKWQEKWRKAGIYDFKIAKDSKKKYYNLVELPYPSGDLHLGHWFAFVPPDAHARYKKMKGLNVFFPNGFDAFGLPAENAAIKNNIHPKDWTMKNIQTMREQFETMGTMIDWSHPVITCEPEYYQWNQWIFLKMFEKGLAYRGKAFSNWCPVDQTVLANEHIEAGRCWRCGAEVVQKEVEQWFLKITDYADELIWPASPPASPNRGESQGGPQNPSVDWPKMVREGQNNWIGKKEGMLIKFPVEGNWNYVLLHGFTGSSKGDFFPWVKKELEKEGSKVQIPDLPNTNSAKVEEQADFVLKNIDFDQNTVLFGHSLGTPVALKVAEQLKSPIKKLVLAAAFAEPGFLDHERVFEKTFNWKFDFEKIKKNVGEVVILRAENDSAVPSERAGFIKEKIGGRIVDFKATADHVTGNEEPVVLENLQPSIEVFTTRPDTVYGATFLVLAPEHPFAQSSDLQAVKQYLKESEKKTQMQRKEDKIKSGVFTGKYVKNPLTNKDIPVWVSDYVLADYGSGAIMAVPAHDERDLIFAKKYDLPIKPVIEALFSQYEGLGGIKKTLPFVEREAIKAIVKHWSEDKYIVLKWKKVAWRTWITGGVEKGQTPEEAAIAEVKEETGYLHPILKKVLPRSHSKFYHVPKAENRFAHFHNFYFELADGQQEKISSKERDIHEVKWLKKSEIESFLTPEDHIYSWKTLQGETKSYDGPGIITNSSELNGTTVPDELDKVFNWFEKHNIGERKVNYHLRDWSVSRQRYWGTPVPIIHCAKCGIVPVPYEDLPIELPYDVDYTPKGKPPLATDENWLKVKCPKCKGEAKRDAETLDTFFDSAWYYYRYCSPVFEKEPFDSKIVEKLMPVDIYFGGSEHTLGHTLYARFFTKFFKDLGLVSFDEFAKKRVQHGVILGPDGNRMSKSKGNVVSPDNIVKEYGADTVRLYLCFMMPYVATAPWSTTAISGVYRFLKRVWDLHDKIIDDKPASPKLQRGELNLKSEILSAEDLFQMHTAIKIVGDDLETLQFNTAVSALMIWVNYLTGKNSISKIEYEALLKILAPFAPHISQELWQLINPTANFIHLEDWPVYQSNFLISKNSTIVIQINGKFRDSIIIENSKIKDQNYVENEAKKSKKVANQINAEIKRAIYIEGKILNFVM